MILRTIVDRSGRPQVFVHESGAGKAGHKTGKAGREMSPEEVQIFCRDIVMNKYLEEGAVVRRIHLKVLIDSWPDLYLEGEKCDKEIWVEYQETPASYRATEYRPLRVLENGKVVFPVVVYVSLREAGNQSPTQTGEQTGKHLPGMDVPFSKSSGPCRLLRGGSYYAQVAFRSSLSIQKDEPVYFGMRDSNPGIEQIMDAWLELDYLSIKEKLAESVQFAKTGSFDVVTSRQEFMLLLYDAFMQLKQAGRVPEVEVFHHTREGNPVLLYHGKDGDYIVRFGIRGGTIKELLLQPVGLFLQPHGNNPDTILPPESHF
ncbi:MAG: hypothetical protein IJ154_06140 [Bacteroidales bacterium]|nr:hypothetical protein [Bacteroidales bacterium]